MRRRRATCSTASSRVQARQMKLAGMLPGGGFSLSIGKPGSGDSEEDIIVRIKADAPVLRPDEPVPARPVLVSDWKSPLLTREVIAGATKRAHLPSTRHFQRGEEHEHPREFHPSQRPHWHRDNRLHALRTSPGRDTAARSLYD